MKTNGLESKVVKNKELAWLAEFAELAGLAVLGCSWDDAFVVFCSSGISIWICWN
jgi:hypothetical protein